MLEKNGKRNGGNNYNCEQPLASKENFNIIPWFHSILV
jgi:hypothetical protein